jgi:hypothetical protein
MRSDYADSVFRSPTRRACARALWLLGLSSDPSSDEVNAAWRARVAKAHPDRHADDDARRAAAETLTRALNEARDVLVAWIESGRDWPEPLGRRRKRTAPENRKPAAPPTAAPESPALRVCLETGLAPGDRVRVWPYDGELDEVECVERTSDGRAVVVRLVRGPALRAHRVRLAGFSCLVCGACAGPAVESPALRPCPDCLTDLRRLEQDPQDAARIRRAIEARATAGLAAARVVGDRRLQDRARARQRWARSLVDTDPDGLQRALLERFSRAYEAWGAPVGTSI